MTGESGFGSQYGWDRGFFLSAVSKWALCPIQLPMRLVLGLSPWGLGHLADHSRDVLRLRMHGRSYATNFPCVFIVWYLIKHRDDFNSARIDQQWNLGLPKNCFDALTGEPAACVHSCHVGSGLVAVLTNQEPVHMSISLQLCFKKLVNSYREHAASYCHFQWVQFCDSLCWWFWKFSFLCKACKGLLRRILMPCTNFVQLVNE